MSNLVEILVTTAQRAGNRPALRHGDHTVTYRELDDASARVAQALRAAGCEPGDRVGLMLPNVPEFPFAYYGALRAGCTVVPMNVMLKQREIAYYREIRRPRSRSSGTRWPTRRAPPPGRRERS